MHKDNSEIFRSPSKRFLCLKKFCAFLSVLANVELFDCNEENPKDVKFFQTIVNLFLAELNKHRDITPHK
jgi:hypothetical protein